MRDPVAPSVVSASMIGRVVTVVFSEPMDPATLIIKGNYSIDGMVILRADLVPKSNNTKTALVVTGFLPSTVYTVFVTGVRDATGNLIEGDTEVMTPIGISSAQALGTAIITQGAAPPFAGMRTWFKSDTGLFQLINGTTPSTSDNDVVGFWTDQGSIGANLTAQGNNTTRPTLQLNEINGYPAIRFDGTDDNLRKTAVQPLSSGNGAWTIFCVMKLTNQDATNVPFEMGTDTGGGTTLITGFTMTTPKLSVDASGGRSFSSANNSFSTHYAAWTILTLRHATGANIGASEAWFNTTSQTISGDAVAFNLGATFPLELGGYLLGAAFASVDIAEFMTYGTALSTTDRTQTYNYLANKYGI